MRVFTRISEGSLKFFKKGGDLYEEEGLTGYGYIGNATKIPLSLIYLQQNAIQLQRLLKIRRDELLVEFEVTNENVMDEDLNEFVGMKELLKLRRSCMIGNNDMILELIKVTFDDIVATYSFTDERGLLKVAPNEILKPEMYPLLSCVMYCSGDGYQRVVDGAGNVRVLTMPETVKWSLANGITGYLGDMTYDQVVFSCTEMVKRELINMFGKVSSEEALMTMEELKHVRGVQ